LIRAADLGDLGEVLALNEASVAETSPLGVSALSALAAQADYFQVLIEGAGVAGFVLALRERATYANPNFEWFLRGYQRFLYVDRVVVAATHRHAGVGSRLYADLERHARATDAGVLACEVNVEPPNAPSLQFHHKLGFREVGRLSSPAKLVALLVKPL
jgi:predicted GNAT superfamily acetyltransferase